MNANRPRGPLRLSRIVSIYGWLHQSRGIGDDGNELFHPLLHQRTSIGCPRDQERLVHNGRTRQAPFGAVSQPVRMPLLRFAIAEYTDVDAVALTAPQEIVVTCVRSRRLIPNPNPNAIQRARSTAPIAALSTSSCATAFATAASRRWRIADSAAWAAGVFARGFIRGAGRSVAVLR